MVAQSRRRRCTTSGEAGPPPQAVHDNPSQPVHVPRPQAVHVHVHRHPHGHPLCSTFLERGATRTADGSKHRTEGEKTAPQRARVLPRHGVEQTND
jgi:hypothetical protein